MSILYSAARIQISSTALSTKYHIRTPAKVELE